MRSTGFTKTKVMVMAGRVVDSCESLMRISEMGFGILQSSSSRFFKVGFAILWSSSSRLHTFDSDIPNQNWEQLSTRPNSPVSFTY